MKSILLLGAPLSGKTTQGRLLATALHGAFVSTGEVIRAHLAAVHGDDNDALSQHVRAGTCAPAVVTDAIFVAALEKLRGERVVVIDGYPREFDQLDAAAAVRRAAGIAPLSLVLLLEIDASTALARLAARASRPDDDVAAARVAQFDARTASLVAHFEERDLLVRIDARAAVDVVARELLRAVDLHARGCAPTRAAAGMSPADVLRAQLREQGGVVSDAQVQAFRDASLDANREQCTGALRRWIYVLTNNATKYDESVAMFATYGLEVLLVPHLAADEWCALAPAASPALLDAARAAVAAGKLPAIDVQHASGVGDASLLELSAAAPPSGAQLETLFVRQLLMCRDLASKIPFAVLRENSELLAPPSEPGAPLGQPSSMRDGVSAVNRATLRVWRRIPETKLLLITTDTSTTSGRINLAMRRVASAAAGPSPFGWDDVFCPDGCSGLTFHELKQRGLKVAARQSQISNFLAEFVHYHEGKDLNHTPQHPTRCVDFALDAAAVMARNAFVENDTVRSVGAASLAYTALEGGAYLRYAFNRRHSNYFLTPVAGLPATPKDDFIHEFVFQTHDIGHLVIQELLFTGNDSFAHRSAMVAVRMLSECMTMVLADMFVVDALLLAKRREPTSAAARAIPDNYDWTKRRIYPLFLATGLRLAEAASADERNANLLTLMQANADLLLKSDESKFVALIERNGGARSTLDAFKRKYEPFFVSDFKWCLKNYDVLRATSDAARRWWRDSAELRAASRLEFESIDDFLRQVALSSDSQRQLDDYAPSELIDVCLRFLFERRLVRGCFGAAPTLSPFWLRNVRAFSRYAVGQMALFAHFAFVDGAHGAQLEFSRRAVALAEQAEQWRQQSGADDGDDAARLAHVLESIGKARTVVEAFLRVLVERHLITLVDEETYREQFPLFAVNYVTYDNDPNSYESLRAIFEREFDRAHRSALAAKQYAGVNGVALNAAESRFVERTLTLVEAAGGTVDQSTFVMLPGVLLLARSHSVRDGDASVGGGGCDDAGTVNVSFLVAGASIETSLEFAAHGEASVARLTSSRTAAMRHPLIRILPHADPSTQKYYHTAMRRHRAQLRQALLRGAALEHVPHAADAGAGRGADEIDNNADTAAKASAFVITMTLANWHRTLLGRCSRDGNEADVVDIACNIANQLHALYPLHVRNGDAYRGAHNNEKYVVAQTAEAAAAAPAVVVAVPAVVSELQLTPAAHRLFGLMHMNVTQPRTDVNRLAEFCMRLTYLSFPTTADYDANEWLRRIVVSTGHLSVVGGARVNILLRSAGASEDAFWTEQTTRFAASSVKRLGDNLHLSFGLKSWLAIVRAAPTELAATLRGLLHSYSEFFI